MLIPYRMLRVLLVLIAVLVAVLAFVFDRPWLYVGAAVPLVGALGLLVNYVRNASASRGAVTDGPGQTPESMTDLGIMDVRPQERQGGGDGASSNTEETSTSRADVEKRMPQDGVQTEPVPVGTSQSEVAKGRDEEEIGSSSTPIPDEQVRPVEDTDPVLHPLLESLRAAVDAETVCLLLQKDVALKYEIEALASVHSSIRRGESFETDEPLLTATMSRQPVTVRQIDGRTRSDLQYYDTIPDVTQVGVAPVGRPGTASTVFLLADATSEVDLNSSRVRSLLDHFADTIEEVRHAEVHEEPSRSAPSEEGPAASTGSDEPDDGTDRGEDEEPRPRGEIVAEEMEAADDASDPLSLVLVHLNRAESIARQGQAEVDRAEQHFRTRLEDLAPGQRVERFGELTYGIFVRQNAGAMEDWAVDLQEAMAGETGVLEGGVSVGVAVRSPDHGAEGLREDATKALLEAYETGTCTIIE